MIVRPPAIVRPCIACDSFAIDLKLAQILGVFAASSDISTVGGRTRLELRDTFQVAGDSTLLTGIVRTHVKDAAGFATSTLATVWEVGLVSSECRCVCRKVMRQL